MGELWHVRREERRVEMGGRDGEIEKEIESKGREKVSWRRGGRKRDRLGDIVVKVRWNGVQKREETLREKLVGVKVSEREEGGDT